MYESALRLFGRSPVTEVQTEPNIATQVQNQSTVEYGYMFDESLVVSSPVANAASEVYGLNASHFNSTFYTTWNQIDNTDDFQHYFNQIVHYVTVALADVGVTDGYVYLPEGQDPKLDAFKRIRVITAIPLNECVIRLRNLVASGVALTDQSIEDIIVVGRRLDCLHELTKVCKNRELQIRLYDESGTVPSNPLQFLQYVLFKTTGRTMIIKDRETITDIKECDVTLLQNYLADSVRPDNLGSIFLRFKPIFLAMKRTPELSRIINKLRRDAKKMHTPLIPSVLDTLVSDVLSGVYVDDIVLIPALAGATFYRKVRIFNALAVAETDPGVMHYPIRSGKGWIKRRADLPGWKRKEVPVDRILHYKNIVRQQLVADLRSKVDGEIIYIPRGLDYAAPTSQKQFIGNIPLKTRFLPERELFVGVHWFNNHNRIDIDLSLIGLSGKVGWNASRRSGGATFSGDITNAPRPRGAAEFFRFASGSYGDGLLIANDYTGAMSKENPGECRIILADGATDDDMHDCIANPSSLVAVEKFNITGKQTLTGLVKEYYGRPAFYFVQSLAGRSNVSRRDELTVAAEQALLTQCDTRLSLNELLVAAGAVVIDAPNPEQTVDLDLCPLALTATTFIELVS